MTKNLVLSIGVVLLASAHATHVASAQDGAKKPLAALDFLIGRWEGSSEGQPGMAQVRREYSRVFGDRYIRAQNQSTYKPQEKNPKGESTKTWACSAQARNSSCTPTRN